ncbi:hypothetical protein KVT40_007895 [Elsinoe batatas]|uniref:Uncharacterized protein n=1 Tax=Elsinoe batatas TaxID=2601811 RepID=A0A8K0KYA9_9PEZI|nr:hypothetical protein KVT40_007895 [Elsinoe batatas]
MTYSIAALDPPTKPHASACIDRQRYSKHMLNMRYQDWDVLLFPQGSHIPLQEFRTSPFLIQEQNHQVPHLLTYVPSLPENAPFTISVHSWTFPKLDSAQILQDGHRDDGCPAWGLRVLVDGVCVLTTTFADQVSWPQLADVGVEKKPLLFPSYQPSILSRRDWKPTDDPGRIKVMLTEGIRFVHEGTTKFQVTRHHICFTYQPAPLELLQRCNIAWPRISSSHARPTRPLTHPTRPSISSTRVRNEGSAYTNTSDTSACGNATNTIKPTREVRLPSDQMRQIISALQRYVPTGESKDSERTTNATRTNRERNISDVTMHAGCTSFPDCTYNDPESGELKHKTPQKALEKALEMPCCHDSPQKQEGCLMPQNHDEWGTTTLGTIGLVPEVPVKKRGRSPLNGIHQVGRADDRSNDRRRKVSKSMVIFVDDDEDKENSLMAVL